ncbi:uncharacterized protein LOC117830239 [Xyrichtys novacula]|uniref:Uncharacterized protein LOC117830239 n=1 Tax=Xyrichtys novacula TaxID=13765 RepID=A0AAV1H4T0_XYRNO|nr:uncharacterized protein LOC117830239 [Xyrichtys novacula]
MMRRRNLLLLLLAVFMLQAKCQQSLKVSVTPNLPDDQIFSGDLFYVNCDGSASGGEVKWYFNGDELLETNKVMKIAVATSKHSGSYHCERNGQKSDTVSINIKEYLPSASLIIKTGQPVMRVGGSVTLELNHDDGLNGWNCWVYRGDETKKIKLKLEEKSTSLDFQPKQLLVPETIFWCSNTAKQQRSNQVIVRTSDKNVSLEMYPFPATAGESLTLSCLVWGTDKIVDTVFYKDGKILSKHSPMHKISEVTEVTKGIYKCRSKYIAGSSYEMSDDQDMLLQEPPLKALLSVNMGMSCSCPRCPGDSSYRWYSKSDDDKPWALSESNTGFLMPSESTTYACRAVWLNGRSSLSQSYAHPPTINSIFLTVIIVVILLGLVAMAIALFMWYKKRTATGPIYEDVGQMSRGKNEYEMLQKSRREGEYDTLHTEAPDKQRKDGGAGGYEALKKEGMKEDVYHTVKMPGAAGGEGGYEALKKEGMKEDVYHTVEMHGAAGGEGGYEALKKEGMKEGVYHTLSTEGAGGVEEGNEASDKAQKV